MPNDSSSKVDEAELFLFCLSETDALTLHFSVLSLLALMLPSCE